MPATELRDKYGAAACDAGLRLQPKTFERRLSQRDSLDQHFTRLWLDFAVSGMARRTVLDARTRLLVIDHLTSPTALIFPAGRIARECAGRGVEVLVDGAHGPGMFDLHKAPIEWVLPTMDQTYSAILGW